MRTTSLLAASSVAIGIGILAVPGVAAAAGGTSYQAQLRALNGSGASGTVTVQLEGSSAAISENARGLASQFMGGPYPHVQHIHGGAQGECPTATADTSGDGVVSTTEGAPAYGGILTTASTKGDTSPAAGTDVKIAPSGPAFTYKRTIQVDAKTIEALKGGTAVWVVHGLDPAKIPAAAQKEPSDLVPSLPLAATSPALCGKLTASQMSSVPSGAADTGGGSTAGVENGGLIGGGVALVAAGALAGGFAMRRRTSTEG